GFIDLEVLFDVGDGWPGVAKLDLFYQEAQQAPARFTGEVREELRDGSLQLWLGVDVIEAGWYAIDANVFDASGTPTAMLSPRLRPPCWQRASTLGAATPRCRSPCSGASCASRMRRRRST